MSNPEFCPSLRAWNVGGEYPAVTEEGPAPMKEPKGQDPRNPSTAANYGAKRERAPPSKRESKARRKKRKLKFSF